MKTILVFLFSVSVIVNVFSQTDDLKKLRIYADAMVNTLEAETRQFASEQFNELVYQYAEREKDFSKTGLGSIKYISNLYAPDSSFRIVTWQSKQSQETYAHFGFIQTKDGKIAKLKDVSKEYGKVNYEILTPDSWYGALYYDIKFVKEGGYYLLFGFNGSNSKEYSKLIDVLTFEPNNHIAFGKEIFHLDEKIGRPDVQTRIFVDYDPSTVVACRMNDDEESIYHDYTTPNIVGFQGEKIGKVPDGTYVAYLKEGHIWKKVDLLPTTPTPEKTPDMNKKRDANQSDLFGKKKSKN